MNQAILKRIETLEAAQSIKITPHILFDGYNFDVIAAPREPKPIIYNPNNTGKIFHADDSSVRLIMGPYGSGKSSICCAEIVRRTCEMPAWCQGIRRSKWVIVRNTTGELTTTTLQTWLHWFGYLGTVEKRQKPVLTYQHTFNDGKGIVEIELLFLALDREDDLRKIRSLEVTGVYINELSEVPRGTIPHFKGRINRYPSRDICGDYFSGIIADTNPPDSDHWIFKLFEEEKPTGYRVFHQPSGLLRNELGKYKYNADADNMAHLMQDYYLQMAEGQNEEFIKVFCMGQYGTVIMGKRVYSEYNDDFHSSDQVHLLKGLPLQFGWDFGLTPACIILQVTDRGQIRIIKEFVAEEMGIRQLTESVILPYLSSELSGMKIEHSVGDPSGSHRSDTDESTCIDTLTELGIRTQGGKSNAIVTRIESVKYFLNRMIDGQPALLVSRQGCPKLRKGFLGDYHYRRLAVMGTEKFQEKPNKNMSSHPHDALQYICLEYYDPAMSTDRVEKIKKISDAVKNPAFRLV